LSAPHTSRSYLWIMVDAEEKVTDHVSLFLRRHRENRLPAVNWRQLENASVLPRKKEVASYPYKTVREVVRRRREAVQGRTADPNTIQNPAPIPMRWPRYTPRNHDQENSRIPGSSRSHGDLKQALTLIHRRTKRVDRVELMASSLRGRQGSGVPCSCFLSLKQPWRRRETSRGLTQR
jgi:hypothetical protein